MAWGLCYRVSTVLMLIIQKKTWYKTFSAGIFLSHFFGFNLSFLLIISNFYFRAFLKFDEINKQLEDKTELVKELEAEIQGLKLNKYDSNDFNVLSSKLFESKQRLQGEY